MARFNSTRFSVRRILATFFTKYVNKAVMEAALSKMSMVFQEGRSPIAPHIMGQVPAVPTSTAVAAKLLTGRAEKMRYYHADRNKS